jgi:hypothetical protein
VDAVTVRRSLDRGGGATLAPVLSPLVVGAACLLVGAGAGVALSRGGGPPRATPTPPAASAAPSPESERAIVLAPTTARLAEEDRAALRAMIREEIGAERSTQATATDAGGARAVDEPPAASLSSDGLRVYDRARADVDRGIARGVWTEDDRNQLRANLTGLPGKVRGEIVRPLIVAANAGKLRVEARGPLF